MATWTSKLPERAPNYRAFRWYIKVGGISIPMMREALAQAKKARLEIWTFHQDATRLAKHHGDFRVRTALDSIVHYNDKIRRLIGERAAKDQVHSYEDTGLQDWRA